MVGLPAEQLPNLLSDRLVSLHNPPLPIPQTECPVVQSPLQDVGRQRGPGAQSQQQSGGDS